MGLSVRAKSSCWAVEVRSLGARRFLRPEICCAGNSTSGGKTSVNFWSTLPPATLSQPPAARSQPPAAPARVRGLSQPPAARSQPPAAPATVRGLSQPAAAPTLCPRQSRGAVRCRCTTHGLGKSFTHLRRQQDKFQIIPRFMESENRKYAWSQDSLRSQMLICLTERCASILYIILS